VRILDGAGSGVSVEIGARTVGVWAEQSITRSTNNRTQTDEWNYRAFGLEAPLLLSYRFNSLLAMTFAPFLRAYFIRAWHDQILTSAGSSTPTTTQSVLQWQPVLSGGIGMSAAFDLGPVQLAPGVALEAATRPGPGAAAHVLFEPGISVGTRF